MSHIVPKLEEIERNGHGKRQEIQTAKNRTSALEKQIEKLKKLIQRKGKRDSILEGATLLENEENSIPRRDTTTLGDSGKKIKKQADS